VPNLITQTTAPPAAPKPQAPNPQTQTTSPPAAPKTDQTSQSPGNPGSPTSGTPKYVSLKSCLFQLIASQQRDTSRNNPSFPPTGSNVNLGKGNQQSTNTGSGTLDYTDRGGGGEERTRSPRTLTCPTPAFFH
jgi:hypothetical protein